MKFKSNIFLTIFVIVLQLHSNIYCIKISKNTSSPATTNSPPIESTHFWLQKFFPGKDPIKYLEQSWKKPEKKFFVLNNSSLYYGKNELTSAIIEGKDY